MDSSVPSPQGGGEGGGEVKERRRRSRRRRVLAMLLRGALSIGFPIAASFLLSFLAGLAGLAIGGLSSSAAVSVPSTCRILSSSVDLRSSKVCELGTLNYRAKHVFYPSHNRRYRCRDDYYWASIFQVEYTEYFSGQISQAIAESPKEALPHDCRPDFGTAWLTRLKFKVNESYSCTYTLGSSKADIYSDKLFNCTAKEPSTAEMVKRIFILFTRSSNSEKSSSERLLGYAMAGVVAGMLTSMFLVILLKGLHGLVLVAARWAMIKHRAGAFARWFRRACLLVAYISAASWIALQYGKMIGVTELLLDSELRERFI